MQDFATILKDIEEIIMDILALEPDEITPNSRFTEDLGAESIDFLELSYQCDKRFGVDVGFQKIASSDEFPTNENGRFTTQAVAAFKSRYPFLDLKDFDEDPTPQRIISLFTVENIARLVETSLAKQKSL